MTQAFVTLQEARYDPRHNRLRNLRICCQRCRLLHDRAYHLAQRRIAYRLRHALGNLLPGHYRRGLLRDTMEPG